MKIEAASVVYADFRLPPAAKVLKPVLFQQGDMICCLLGPDPQEGVFGCGNTATEAVEDWERHLKDRLINADITDKLILQIIDELNMEAGWRRLKELERQFKSS